MKVDEKRIPSRNAARDWVSIVYYVTREEKQRWRTSARCASQARADIARVEIVASIRVTYTVSHNLLIVNSTLRCLYSGAKSNDFTP